MKLCVIGTGYVGLVAGTCFADSGNLVTCVDINSNKINQLNRGEVPIFEPGLDQLIQRNVRENRLSFTTDFSYAIENSDVAFIAVGTPPNEDGSADLKHVLAVAKHIGQAMTHNMIVVNKSTVPVGTADKVSEAVQKELTVRKVTHSISVISNPEFLKEGTAIDDFMKPDRIIIGGSNNHALEIMNQLYAPFLRTDNRLFTMDNRSAEMTKYAANSYLATRISFMNELANLCEKMGADVDCVRKGMGSDQRIGNRFLFPGVGYGGSCFPKDVKALVSMAREQQLPFRILESVEAANAHQKQVLMEKIQQHYQQADLSTKHFCIWGLAFKPKTDDIREAPSLTIINALLAAGASITVYDPEAMQNINELYGKKLLYAKTNMDALTGCNALIILTEWNEFRNPDFSQLNQKLLDKVIFDGRNIFDPRIVKNEGLRYYSIGR